jgi:CBS domain containing-hemolysin-like protein
MEDLLEEIVGEIYDEHDEPEAGFEVTAEGETELDGGTSIDEVNERFGLELSSADFDTIGGYIFGALGRPPVLGDTIALETGLMVVAETEGRRITRVRIRVAASEPEPDPVLDGRGTPALEGTDHAA